MCIFTHLPYKISFNDLIYILSSHRVKPVQAMESLSVPAEVSTIFTQRDSRQVESNIVCLIQAQECPAKPPKPTFQLSTTKVITDFNSSTKTTRAHLSRNDQTTSHPSHFTMSKLHCFPRATRSSIQNPSPWIIFAIYAFTWQHI